MSVTAVGATNLNVTALSAEIAGMRQLADLPSVSPVFAGIAASQNIYTHEDETLSEEEALATTLVRAAALVTNSVPVATYRKQPSDPRDALRRRIPVLEESLEPDEPPSVGTRFDSAA